MRKDLNEAETLGVQMALEAMKALGYVSLARLIRTKEGTAGVENQIVVGFTINTRAYIQFKGYAVVESRKGTAVIASGQVVEYYPVSILIDNQQTDCTLNSDGTVTV